MTSFIDAPGDRAIATPESARGEDGFILVDAIVALVVAAGVLASIYGLISATYRASGDARRAVFTAQTIHAACVEASRSRLLRTGLSVRQAGDMRVSISVGVENGTSLPGGGVVWRIDCAAESNPRATQERTYIIRPVEPSND